MSSSALKVPQSAANNDRPPPGPRSLADQKSTVECPAGRLTNATEGPVARALTQSAGTGYLYVAIGEKCTQQFLISLKWLRQSDPHTPVAVLSDILPPSTEYRLIRTQTTTAFETRSLKTSLDSWTPFEKTLYMDTDTIAIGVPAQAFEYLDSANFAMALDDEMTVGSRVNVRMTSWSREYLGAEEIAYTRRYPASLPFYNSGVIAWERGPRSSQVFSAWRREWERFRKTDQLPLARALFDGKYQVAELPKTYNLSHTAPNAVDAATARAAGIRIIHFWLHGHRRLATWR